MVDYVVRCWGTGLYNMWEMLC